MIYRESSYYWRLRLASSLAIVGVIACPFANNAFAQLDLRVDIVPNRNLRTKVVPLAPKTDLITGGTRPQNGSSLFHSFAEFNIRREREVYFYNPAGVKNIFSRVTGNDPSNILGKLGLQDGKANLFLINPKGIIFGPNASLDLQGSLLASTARSLNFDDGTQFSATAPQSSPLLTVSVPVGLQFGETAADIHMQGSFLEVQSGKTLGLLGGNVTLKGAALVAPRGRIELGSVASNSLVSLNPMVEGWSLGYEKVKNFQDIQLKRDKFSSEVNVSGEGSGDVQVQGRKVILVDESLIRSINLGTEPGGNLTVAASESVELIGKESGLSSSTVAAGKAGDITIKTDRLLLGDRAFVSTETLPLAAGRGGNLTVVASEVELENYSLISTSTQGPANAGDIVINTGRLLLRDGAETAVSSLGTGDAGNLGVRAQFVFLDNQGKLLATSESGKGGGNIALDKLNLLLLNDKSEISTNADGSGDGGNITINTDLLVALENSDITANAIQGMGGNVRITTQGIFGTQARERRTSESDITASSELGIDGVVEINTPDVDPDEQAVNLPEEVVDVSGLVAQSCPAGGGAVARGLSEFVVTGRGGLPPTPGEALKSDMVLVDPGTPIVSSTEQPPASKRLSPVTSDQATPEEPLRQAAGHIENRSSPAVSTNSTHSASAPVTEAQGWVIGSNGEVVLTTQAPTVTPHPSGMTSVACHGS